MHINSDTVFIFAWFAVTITILTIFYVKGNKALSIFPDINSVRVRYRDRFASGYSTKSSGLKRGRASSALDIVVTDKELWLKGMLLFAGLLNYFDLLQKIPWLKLQVHKKTVTR